MLTNAQRFLRFMNNDYGLYQEISPATLWSFCERDPERLEAYGRHLWEKHVESKIPSGAVVLREMVPTPNFYELALELRNAMEEFDPDDYRPMD